MSGTALPTSEPTRPTASPPLGRSVALIAADIKLSHSVFALPFAVLGTFLAAASDGRRPRVGEFVLIVVCMVTARTVAMAVNRWADAAIDAGNPRTSRRAVPSGRLPRSAMAAAAAVCAGLFVAACGGFWLAYGNPWPVVLSPAVLAFLGGYSFAKRFTWLCHAWLGLALAASPVAAALAIHPAALQRPDIWLLAAMVACWVAGFDVIYALQDVTVDRAAGLNSLPARFGAERALWVSRALHAAALAALVMLTLQSPWLGVLFGGGVALVAALLALEHALVWGSRTHHLNMAFFTVNGVVSVVLGALGVVEVWRAL